MAITDEQRHRLYQRLEVVLGDVEAATLMEHLPPVGWADVTTKRDLDHATVLTKRDVDHGVALLRHDLEHLGSELRAEMGALGSELRAEIAVGQRQIVTTMVFAMLAANATLAGLAFGAARLA